MNDQRRGLKLIEVMVIIGVIGLLMGILVPAMRIAQHSSHRPSCQYNMKNVGLGLVQFSITKNHYPNAGTFYDDPNFHGGDLARSDLYGTVFDDPKSHGVDP